MKKYGYIKNEKKNRFFEDESKCTKHEIIDILKEVPEYKDFFGGKYMIEYETLWKIPFSFKKAIEFNSSKEFLLKYGKVTKSIRKLPIPLAFNLLKCGIKYEPVIKHCIENMWLTLYFLYRSFSQVTFIKEKNRKEMVCIPLFKSIHTASWTWNYDRSQDGEAEYEKMYSSYHYVEGHELIPDIFNMLKTLEESPNFKKND